MKLAFGPMARRNDSLFQSLRSMSLRRGVGAPVGPTVEDLQEFERRNGVRGLRTSLETARQAEDKAFRSIKSQLDNFFETLSHLKMQEKRTEYFNRVDSLRAQALPTLDSGECGLGKALPRKRGNGAAAAVAQFLQICTDDVDEGSPVEQRSKLYMDLLVDYLAHRPQPSPRPESEIPKVEPDPMAGRKGADEAEDEQDEAEGADDGPDPALSPTRTNEPRNRKCRNQSRCLLGCGSFRGRGELTKHYQRMHVRNGRSIGPSRVPSASAREWVMS